MHTILRACMLNSTTNSTVTIYVCTYIRPTYISKTTPFYTYVHYVRIYVVSHTYVDTYVRMYIRTYVQNKYVRTIAMTQ